MCNKSISDINQKTRLKHTSEQLCMPTQVFRRCVYVACFKLNKHDAAHQTRWQAANLFPRGRKVNISLVRETFYDSEVSDS